MKWVLERANCQENIGIFPDFSGLDDQGRVITCYFVVECKSLNLF